MVGDEKDRKEIYSKYPDAFRLFAIHSGFECIPNQVTPSQVMTKPVGGQVDEQVSNEVSNQAQNQVATSQPTIIDVLKNQQNKNLAADQPIVVQPRANWPIMSLPNAISVTIPNTIPNTNSSANTIVTKC